MASITRDLLQIPAFAGALVIGGGTAIVVFRLLHPGRGRPFPGGVFVRFPVRCVAGFLGALAGIADVALTGYGYTLGPDCGRGSGGHCFEGIAHDLSRAAAFELAAYLAVVWAIAAEWWQRKVTLRPPAV